MRSLTVKTAAVATVFALSAAAQLGAQNPRSIQAPRADGGQQSVIRFGQQAPPAAAQNPALGPEEDVDGTLEVLVEDRADGALVHHFLDSNRGRVRLRETAGRTELAGLITGTRIRAHGRWAQDGALELNNSTGGSSVTTTALAAPNTFGVQKVAVIMVNFQDDASQPQAWTQAADVTFNQVSSFFMENSYGQTSLTGDVFGWFTIAMSSSVCDTNTLASLADQKASQAGVNLNNYTRIVYSFPRNACSWWGLGTVGGNPSRAWIKGTYSLKVVAHELGHNFGDWHSNSQPCESAGCTTTEYGHDRDMMGGTGTAHFNAFQKERLGWLNYGGSPTIQTISGPGTYYISSLSSAGTGPKGLKVLQSSTTSGRNYYYIEARTQSGFDGGYAPGVQLSTGNDTNGNSSYQVDLDPLTAGFDTMLDPGQSFSDLAAGFTITTTSVDAGGAWVQIDYAGAPCTERTPTVTLSPGGTVTTQPGVSVNYTLSVKNNDDASCPVSDYAVAMEVPAGFAWGSDRAYVNAAPGTTSSANLVVTPPSTASGTNTVRGQASRTDGPSGASSTAYLNVQAPITSIAMALQITSGSQYTMTATVTGGGAGVAGATVTFRITDPRGGVKTLNATTGANGVAQVRVSKPRGKDPRGTYAVSATAAWNGLTASASGSFVY